jgi:hypothetical protein
MHLQKSEKNFKAQPALQADPHWVTALFCIERMSLQVICLIGNRKQFYADERSIPPFSTKK